MKFTVLKNKRVFLTGHTGFKGSWLALWLRRLGAEVYGYSLPPPTSPSNYALARVGDALTGETIADIRDRDRMAAAVAAFKPDALFHLAAQPLVRDSYAMPYETFEVNVMGTASVLDAVRAAGHPCAVVCITTDKCYENREQVWGYRECDPMGGHDPYSASKGAAEILIASYRRSFFHPADLARHGVQLASARAGNVVGGGDWAKDRIVTDMVAALAAGRPVPVRNPLAIRPWQHVLEPLSGYLTLAAAMLEQPDPKWSESWNFGPVSGTELPVGRLVDAFVAAWGSGHWEDRSDPSQPHEASILRLSIEKAGWALNWRPRWSCDEMVRRTAQWYRRVLCEGSDARAACENDIAAYGTF
ncbi:MAG: CDP-glucose 4,6-dehydratase [Kiritimatiellae bacterium]|nr:CDP-glucose 4,6-dehydratase [Kiritimatiellia bacterium]